MDEIQISEKISYLASSEDPLSADVGIIRENGTTWLYDVGDGEQYIKKTDDGYTVVLSHFHKDHTGNIDKVRAKELYLSKETYAHVGKGIVVSEDIYVGNLHVFPLPSSHAKGCLGLEVDSTYAFVGDAIYSKAKDGCLIFNAQLLREEIAVLKGLKASVLLVSHYDGLVRKKEDVIAELEEIYRMREKSSSEIRIKPDVE